MDSQNKYKQFFEQVEGKVITAEVIVNAVRATGYTPELEPVINGYAGTKGIDVQKELAELAAVGGKAKQEKAMREAVAAIAEQSGAFAVETDIEKRNELIESIRRAAASLGTVTTESKVITSKELMKKQFPPRQWTVKGIIGPGLTILSGVTKIGKSWLIFALTEAASSGGKFLDLYEVNKTPVLHISLEDSEQNIKEKREMLARKQGGFEGNDNLFIFTEWKTGPDGLENYLRANKEIKLVIIDTLGQFIPDIENMNDYTPAVKALTGIKRIADSLNVAILAVHHARKGNGKEIQGDWMDQSLGSQGIVGSADTVILLKRDINTKTGERLNTGKLYATGRSIKDIFHDVEFLPDFGMWAVTDRKKREPEIQDKTAPNQELSKEERKAEIDSIVGINK